MATKRHERTLARRAALQVLFTSEITDESPAGIADGGHYLLEEDVFEGGVLPEYAEALIRGVSEHCESLDAHLIETSENWSLARMPIVDRSLLRLATYEMIYVDDVPISVAINEAVELAKDFGGEDESPRFVNGVLGRISKSLEAEGVSGEGASEAVAETTKPAGAEELAAVSDPAVSEESTAVVAVADAEQSAAVEEKLEGDACGA